MYRYVTIPKFLHEIHGEKARIFDLVIVYLAGIGAAAVVLIGLLPPELTAWKSILSAVLTFDIAGGVVANFSRSTNRYYQAHPSRRLPYLLIHILQPGLFAIMFPSDFGFIIFFFLYTVPGAIVIDRIRDSETRQNAASFLTVTGISIGMLFPPGTVLLSLIAPLFMIKLILGFAAGRGSASTYSKATS